MNNETAISDEEAYIIINNIDENIGDIKSNVEDINDFLKESEFKEDEQKTEKTDGEKKEEDKKEQTREIEQPAEEESSVTLETISAQIETTNSLIQDSNNLATVNIFSQGILIGVILLALFWKRLVK